MSNLSFLLLSLSNGRYLILVWWSAQWAIVTNGSIDPVQWTLSYWFNEPPNGLYVIATNGPMLSNGLNQNQWFLTLSNGLPNGIQYNQWFIHVQWTNHLTKVVNASLYYGHNPYLISKDPAMYFGVNGCFLLVHLLQAAAQRDDIDGPSWRPREHPNTASHYPNPMFSLIAPHSTLLAPIPLIHVPMVSIS